MASRWEIESDLRHSMNQANRLDEIARSVSKASSGMGNALHSVQSGWTGENAALYIGKGGRLQGNIESSANSLRSIASTIRSVAQSIYDAEMEALRIAEERDNH